MLLLVLYYKPKSVNFLYYTKDNQNVCQKYMQLQSNSVPYIILKHLKIVTHIVIDF